MKVSVITVCYNAVSNIEKTIRSVLEQTYSDIEYIVIDGGSIDGTIDIINKYSNYITRFVSESDNGIYDAMNKGIKLSSGEWLSFMNAGDIYTSSNTLKLFVEEIPLFNQDNKSTIKILRGNIVRVYPQIKVLSTGITKQKPGLIDMLNNTFHHQACLIHSSLFKEFGLYSTEYKLCSDWKFFFDCVVLHHVESKYVNMVVSHFMMDGESSLNTTEYIKEQRHYIKKVYGEELSEILYELSVYRKSFFIRQYYILHELLINNIPPRLFVCLLTIKRIVKSVFGFQVN